MSKKEEYMEFYKNVDGFFHSYLKGQRGFTDSTVKSYKHTICKFIKFVATQKNVEPLKISFSDMTRETVLAFLDDYEKRGCTATTRNQRRAAIASFISYAAFIDPTKYAKCQEIRSIPNKKAQVRKGETVLTARQMKLIVEQASKNPDPKLAMRDTLFLILLFEWGLRISEITSLPVGAINLKRIPPQVTILGKGPKVRYLTISEGSANMIREYADYFGITLRRDNQEPFFATIHDGKRGFMSTANASAFLKKYAKQAQAIDPSLPKRVHPHLIRHSRATDLLYQVPMPFISLTLGHAHFSTTERYIEINPDIAERTILESAKKDGDRFGDLLKPNRFRLTDEQEIAQLYGIAD